MNKLVIFATLLILAFATVDTYACWCVKDAEETASEANFRKTITRAVKSATLVFSGTVVEDDGKGVRFKVSELWKGDEKAEIVLPFLHLPGEKGDQYFIDSCAFVFEVGKSYLVFAVDEKDSAKSKWKPKFVGVTATKCGRTNFLDAAHRDVTELRRLKPSKTNR